MTYQPQFGSTDGLERRLAYWANQLSRDKSFPWVGTGIVEDLKLASATLGAPPFDELYPLPFTAPAAPPPAPPPAPAIEYDL